MQDKLFNIILHEDEVTWQSMIYELVKGEEIDPWDINISLLTKRYIEMLKKLKSLDFRISGKVVLAAALLLNFKSNQLISEDIVELDRLIEGSEEDIGDFYEGLEEEFADLPAEAPEYPPLLPRTPQPRKRKISVFDLVNALQKALEVKERRVLRHMPKGEVELPEKKVVMTELIKQIYERIVNFFKQNQRLTFKDLTPSGDKEDKVYTFMPLLHLAHADQRKISLVQKEHFGEIEIILNKKG